MKFATTILLCLAAAAADAAKPRRSGALTTHSAAGQKLLSSARQLNNDNNNVYYNWIAKYSIKFDGCAAVPGFERDEGMRTRLLAKFKLCPSDKCGACPHYGEYVTDMREFVEAFQNSKQEAMEYNCQVTQEDCEYKCENGLYEYEVDYNYNNNNNNGNNNNNYCEYICMKDAGMDMCNQESGDQGFDMEELSECRPLGDDDKNNNNRNGNYNYGYDPSSYQQYYVGAYCTSSGVYVGTFTDSACTKHAKKGTYYEQTGYYLPTEPLVDYSCISCKEVDNDENNNNNNNNNGGNNNNANNYYGNDYYDADNVLETCERLYEEAGKCESKIKNDKVLYKDTSGCDTIHKTLPRLTRAFRSNGFSTSVFLAWLFGIGCVLLGGYIFVIFHKQDIRQKIGVSKSRFLDDVPDATPAENNGVSA